MIFKILSFPYRHPKSISFLILPKILTPAQTLHLFQTPDHIPRFFPYTSTKEFKLCDLFDVPTDAHSCSHKSSHRLDIHNAVAQSQHKGP